MNWMPEKQLRRHCCLDKLLLVDAAVSARVHLSEIKMTLERKIFIFNHFDLKVPEYVQDDLLLTALLDVHVLHGEQSAEDTFHLGEVQPARLVLREGRNQYVFDNQISNFPS